MIFSRLLLISVFTISFILSGIVQGALAQSVQVGVTGGVNISSHLKSFRFADGDINLNLDPKVAFGYQAGIAVRTPLSRSLRLQAEPSVILLGARYEESFTLRGFDFQTDSRTELLYIQMPLLLQLTTSPPDRTIFGRPRSMTTYHISGGIFGGYLVDAKFSGTNTGAPIGIPFEGNFSNDVMPQYSEYDGGVMLGVGLEHGSNNKFGFETRAQFSVIDSGNAPQLRFEPQNMAITFSVYFMF